MSRRAFYGGGRVRLGPQRRCGKRVARIRQPLRVEKNSGKSAPGPEGSDARGLCWQVGQRRVRTAAAIRACCASSGAPGAAASCVSRPAADIRPTPDRVRETLFNWLQRAASRARVASICSPAAARSGSRRYRAAPRTVYFVDQNAQAIARCARCTAGMGRRARSAELVRHRASATLRRAGTPFRPGVSRSAICRRGAREAASAARGSTAGSRPGRWFTSSIRRPASGPPRAAGRLLRATGEQAGEVGYDLYEYR